MLQWHPRLVAVVAILVVVAAALGGYIESVLDGMTW